jgi:hypothetical protein
MARLDELKTHLRPGHVYRREDLLPWSRAVDRHLKQLVGDGTLTKLAGGLYLRPKDTVFGKAPPDDDKLVESFLKDNRFLLASPKTYNQLGVGTTQLYDETVVYNHKRHGRFSLGGRVFDFRVKPSFPKSLSKEFLLVDLVNNVDQLAENREQVLKHVKQQVLSTNRARLERYARAYGNVRARKFFQHALTNAALHVA